MSLPEYIKKLSQFEAIQFRKRLIARLKISQSYARHLCNGTNKLPAKYAIAVEALTDGAVPRIETAPDNYPETEYEELYARFRKSITPDMD